MKLRILHLQSPTLRSPYLSPFAANARWLAPALRERGHDVTVRLSDNPSRDALLAEGFDIVHVHEASGAHPAHMAGRGTRVVTAYSTPATAPAGTPWVALAHQQASSAAGAAAAVIAPALSDAEIPFQREAGDALVFVTNGLDEFALARALAVARWSERPLTVVMPANSAPSDACAARLKTAGPGVDLVVADRLMNPDLFANAAALLAFQPCAFDMAALTAMACGTPVITLQGHPAAEVIVGGESGFVCASPEDAGRWLDRLDLLDPALGRARARTLFAPETAAAQHEQLYRSLLDGPAPAFRHPDLLDAHQEPGRTLALAS